MKTFAVLLLAVFLGVSMSTVQAERGHWKGHHGKVHAVHYRGGHGGHHNRHHGHHRSHSSFVFSYGYYGYPFSYYPYSYPERIVIHDPAPPVIYIEKSDQQEPRYWYYCKDPEGYYPHVERCPTGWMKVVPESPGP